MILLNSRLRFMTVANKNKVKTTLSQSNHVKPLTNPLKHQNSVYFLRIQYEVESKTTHPDSPTLLPSSELRETVIIFE